MPLLAYMCCTDHPPSLPLIQPAFNLVDQHIARPAVLCDFLCVPKAFFVIRELVQQSNIVSPRNLCSRLLHKFIVRIAPW